MTDTAKPRQCYFIPPGQSHPTKGFVPSLVTEGEAGHQPLTGRGELSEPWFWGSTYEEALTVCAKANDDLGLTAADVIAIVESSITEAIRADAARDRALADVDAKLGRRPEYLW